MVFFLQVNGESKMKKVTLYEVWASDSERSSSSRGFWTNKQVARIDMKGMGWYGSDGRINGEFEGLYDEINDKYYKLVENVNDRKISKKEWKERMETSIKEKLTKSELDYLNLNK